jgi:hypothetical protein
MAIIALCGAVPSLEANMPGPFLSLKGGTARLNGSGPVAGAINKLFAEETRKWWLWDFSLPAATNPTVTPGANCRNGQSGQVWYLYGGPPTVDCHIPFGKSVFFPVVNTECSDLEVGTPFYGANASERAACAKAWIDHVTDLSLKIDNIEIRILPLLRVQSGDFSFQVPAGNILGVPGPATGRSTGDGYYMLLPILCPGVHHIHLKGTFHDPFDSSHPVVFPLETEITLTVEK